MHIFMTQLQATSRYQGLDDSHSADVSRLPAYAATTHTGQVGVHAQRHLVTLNRSWDVLLSVQRRAGHTAGPAHQNPYTSRQILLLRRQSCSNRQLRHSGWWSAGLQDHCRCCLWLYVYPTHTLLQDLQVQVQYVTRYVDWLTDWVKV